MKFTQHRKVQKSDEQHGKITSFSGAEFLVDLVACTCTCGRYQVNNIPCGHAAACIVKLQKEPRNYVPEIFSLQKYLQTYNRNVLTRQCYRVRSISTLPSPILNLPCGRPKERKGEKQRKRFRQAAGGLGDRYCWLYTALLEDRSRLQHVGSLLNYLELKASCS